MVEPADRDFLRPIFLMEAWETVAALEDAGGRAAGSRLDALRVVTHRLKGAASLHGFPEVDAALLARARGPIPKRCCT